MAEIIHPGALDSRAQFSEDISEMKEQLEKQVNRLRELRIKKVEEPGKPGKFILSMHLKGCCPRCILWDGRRCIIERGCHDRRIHASDCFYPLHRGAYVCIANIEVSHNNWLTCFRLVTDYQMTFRFIDAVLALKERWSVKWGRVERAQWTRKNIC